jgi:hypothetical protein
MRNFVGDSRLVHGRNGVPASHDGDRSLRRSLCHSVSNRERPLRERGHLEDAHGAIPNDCLGMGQLGAESCNRFRPNIQAHPVVRRRAHCCYLRLGVRFELRAQHVIARQQQGEVALSRLFEQLARQDGGFRRSEIPERAVNHGHKHIRLMRFDGNCQQLLETGIAGEIDRRPVFHEDEVANVG